MAAKLGKGTRIRVRDGIVAPDLTEFSIAGWTGVISNTTGRGDAKKIFVEWDADTIANMPADYLSKCEEQQLYHIMACLKEDDLEAGE